MTLIPENIDWSRIAKPDFWLEGIAGQNLISQPISENGFRNLFLLIFSVFLIGGILLRLLKLFIPIQHPLQPKLSIWTGNFIWMGILGIMWWLFNQWGPLLFIGSKLWLIFGFIWLLVTLFLIVKYFVTDFKLEMIYFKKKYSSYLNAKSTNTSKIA